MCVCVVCQCVSVCIHVYVCVMESQCRAWLQGAPAVEGVAACEAITLTWTSGIQPLGKCCL